MPVVAWLQDRSFRLKLIAAAILAVMATVALLAWRNLALVEDALQDQTRLRIEQLSPLLNAALATPLAQRDYAAIEEVLRRARVERGIEYLALFDRQDRLVASLGWDMAHPLPQPGQDLVTAIGDQRLDSRIPITLAGHEYGSLQYGVSLRFVAEARERMLHQMAGVSLAGIGFAAVLLFGVGFVATRRLADLNAAGRKLGTGDLSIRVQDQSQDELGQLAQTFNAMAASLENRISQLRASEERLDYAVRGSSDGIWDWDVARGRYYLSPRYRELLGYGEADLPNTRDSFLGGLHPEDRPRVEEAVRLHFEQRAPYDIEYRLRRSDGGYRWFRGRGQAVWDAQGRVIRFSGASSDITVHKSAEANIQALLAEQQAILDNVLVGIVFLRNRVILRCNRRFEELFGYREGEMIGRTTEIVYPTREVFETIGREAYGAVARNETFSTELHLRRKDGGLFWGLITGRALDPAQPQAGSVWIYADMSERQRAMEALRHEKDFSEALINSLPGVFGLIDQSGRLVRWNTNLETLTGYEADELAAMFAERLFAQEDRESVRAATASAVNSGEASVEALLETKAGQRIPHFVTGVRVDIEGITHLLGVGIDVSERRRAEEEVRRLNAELERRVRERTAELLAANRELEAFSYSVSHDLTAPLRGIDGFSRMLEEDYVDRLDERGKGYIRRIRGGTHRMHQLIDDLLSLSRVTRDEMKRTDVDLSALAAQVLMELRQHQPQRRVEVSITSDIRVQGDPNLLRIALENLLRNAWKFTARHASAHIELGVLHAEGKRVYFVKDDGAGFEMKYAGKLFGAFQRMHRVSDFDGTGIGLAIVHRIVHRHGGRIWADAAPEKGATFFFTLS